MNASKYSTIILWLLLISCTWGPADTQSPTSTKEKSAPTTHPAVDSSPASTPTTNAPSQSGQLLTTQVLVPSDFSSLTAKEILAENDKTVSQIAGVYTAFGAFITLIITFIGVFVGVLGWVAKKNVDSLIREYRERFEKVEFEIKKVETDIKQAGDRLKDSVAQAQVSATEAARCEQEIKNSQTVLDKALKDMDEIKSFYAAQGLTVPTSNTASAASSNQQEAAVPAADQSSLTEEEAKVSALVKEYSDPNDAKK